MPLSASSLRRPRALLIRAACLLAASASVTVLAGATAPQALVAVEPYEIEAVLNHKYFVINQRRFTAFTECPSFEAGDPVLFQEGSPDGECETATLLNVKKNSICEVHCE